MVGPTSEFSLFFRVKPGAAEALRAAPADLQMLMTGEPITA
jgi:hypothetical protein